MTKYFIIVLVTYDFNRFQRNLTVFTEDEKILPNLLEMLPKYANLKMYDYKEDEEPKELKENETEHLWIQEMQC